MSQDSSRLAKLGVIAALSGLSVAGLIHKQELENWLSHSFDREDIMKEFGHKGAESPPFITSRGDSKQTLPSTEPPRAPVDRDTEKPSFTSGGNAGSTVDSKETTPKVSRTTGSFPSSSQPSSTPQTADYLAAERQFGALKTKLALLHSLPEDSIPAELVVAKERMLEVEATFAALGKQLQSGGWNNSNAEKLKLAQTAVADVERTVEMIQAEDVIISEARDGDGAQLLTQASHYLREPKLASNNTRAIMCFKGARKAGAVLNAQHISQLAEAYSSVGKHAEARVELVRAIRSESNNEQHYAQLLRLLTKTERTANDDSINTKFRHTVEGIGNRLAISRAAAAFFTNERPNETLALAWHGTTAQEIMAGRAAGCLPSECFATLTLVAAHYSKDATSERRAYAVSLWEKAKESATTLDEKKQISQLLIGAKQFESGLRVLAEILKQAPDGNASTWADFTMVGSMEKNRSTAGQLLNQILETHPTCAEALAALETVAPHDLRQIRRANYVKWSLQLKEAREELKRFDQVGKNNLPAEIVIANSIMTEADRELEAVSALVNQQSTEEAFGIALFNFKIKLARVETLTQSAHDDENAGLKFEQLYSRKELLTRAEAALVDTATEDTIRNGIRCYKAARRMSHLTAPEVHNLASLYCRVKGTDEAKVELNRAVDLQNLTANSALSARERQGHYHIRMLLGELYHQDGDPKNRVLANQFLSQAFTFAREATEFERLGNSLFTVGAEVDGLRAWATSLKHNPDATNRLWDRYLEVGSSPKHRDMCVSQLRDITREHPNCRRALEALSTLDPNDPTRRLATEYQEELQKVTSIRQLLDDSSSAFGAKEPVEVVLAKAELSKLEPLLQSFDRRVKNSAFDESFRTSLSGLKVLIASIQQRQREATQEAEYVRKLAAETSVHDLITKGQRCLESTSQEDRLQATRYLKARRLKQDDTTCTNNIGVAYYLLKRHAEAKIEYLRAIHESPHQQFFYQNFLRAHASLIPNQDSAKFKTAYLEETSVGDRFMACYSAGLLYQSESPDRAHYWFQRGAELLRQGHGNQAPASYRDDCLARVGYAQVEERAALRALPVEEPPNWNNHPAGQVMPQDYGPPVWPPLRREPNVLEAILAPFIGW